MLPYTIHAWLAGYLIRRRTGVRRSVHNSERGADVADIFDHRLGVEDIFRGRIFGGMAEAVVMRGYNVMFWVV